MKQNFDKRTASIRTPAAGGAVFQKRKKTMKPTFMSVVIVMVAFLVIVPVCAIADGYLTHFVFQEFGIRLTGFETAILTAVGLVAGTISIQLAQIVDYLSKIAKSLEKKGAKTKSPETSDELGDK